MKFYKVTTVNIQMFSIDLFETCIECYIYQKWTTICPQFNTYFLKMGGKLYLLIGVRSLPLYAFVIYVCLGSWSSTYK